MEKKKVKSIGCILMLVLCMFVVSFDVHAEEDRKQIDGSYLTDESESMIQRLLVVKIYWRVILSVSD